MTFEVFERQMARLEGLKFRPPSLQTHWEALKDMPEVLLDAAISKAQPEISDFPTPKMLKIFADQVRSRVIPIPEEDPSRGVDLPEPVVLGSLPTGTVVKATREWRYYCQDCRDSGWRAVWCGDGGGRCERRREHYAHEFVVTCGCSQTNPELIRRRERLMQTARRGGDE